MVLQLQHQARLGRLIRFDAQVVQHFVVVFRITKKYVIVGDPAKDIERISIDDFYKKFTGAMLLLKPNSELRS